MWRVIFWVARIAAIAIFCVAAWVASRTPTGQDSEATGKILVQYRVAATNMVNDGPLRIASSPTRGGTRLFVYGDLSASDEQVLKTLAVQISRSNSNRPVSVEFRKEFQPDTRGRTAEHR
jgi:hypothetical protein